MIDELFVSYECNGKYFSNYKDAWFYGKSTGCRKVRYLFTPTDTLYNRVGELERAFQKYCQKTTGCDYYDFRRNFGYKQLNLIGEI